jgi:DNA helicase HerA-like ATPase
MISIPIGQGARPAAILGAYANRHGLICGATGTGKTFTLATLAEGFSRAGVPVFLCDVKGDLAGMAIAGRGAPAPVRFLDVYGIEGDRVRVPVRDFGAELLSRVLVLSPVQGEVLAAMFGAGGRLDSLGDLAARLATPRHEFRATKASLDSIARALITFRQSGADQFFGRPAFDLASLEAPQASGAGLVTVLAAERLIRSPDLYGAFLLWLLGALYDRAPEIGDCSAPRLVLIFDEAHLIFRDASPALLRRIEQTVRLIRSKAIGVYFASQAPADIPPAIAAQLANRVQHAMRAATLADRREIQGAADCLPVNPKIRTAELIATMATGTALVSTLDANGRPTPVDVVRVNAPNGRLGVLSPGERAPFRLTAGEGSPGRVKGKGERRGVILAVMVLGAVGWLLWRWPEPSLIVLGLVAIVGVAAVAKAR